MKKICFVVPYFGSLPKYTQVWLESCKNNETVNWILFTNDKTKFDYPENVNVIYCEFGDIKKLVQSNYDFKIELEEPYKLVDYKIAYGEIFKKYLTDYDFWGYCDIDVIWGDIRRFYTEELLQRYRKLGCQGHCSIYLNTEENNKIYKNDIGDISYVDVFTSKKIFASDRVFIEERFERVGYYKETVYAGLQIVEPGFYLQSMPKNEGVYNKRQVFYWKEKKLYRYYLFRKQLYCKEFLYIHFFKRPMKNKITDFSKPILIFPDVYMNFEKDVDEKVVKKYGHKNIFSFYIRVIKQNYNKVSLHKIKTFIINRINPKYK